MNKKQESHNNKCVFKTPVHSIFLCYDSAVHDISAPIALEIYSDCNFFTNRGHHLKTFGPHVYQDPLFANGLTFGKRITQNRNSTAIIDLPTSAMCKETMRVTKLPQT